MTLLKSRGEQGATANLQSQLCLSTQTKLASVFAQFCYPKDCGDLVVSSNFWALLPYYVPKKEGKNKHTWDYGINSPNQPHPSSPHLSMYIGSSLGSPVVLTPSMPSSHRLLLHCELCPYGISHILPSINSALRLPQIRLAPLTRYGQA